MAFQITVQFFDKNKNKNWNNFEDFYVFLDISMYTFQLRDLVSSTK